MADPRFFSVSGPFSLKKLAEITEANIGEGCDEERLFTDIRPLSEAGPDDVSFLDNRLYIGEFEKSNAGACLVHPDLVERAPAGMSLLITEMPYHAYAVVAQAFYPPIIPNSETSPMSNIDTTAHIGENCKIDAGVSIGPNAVIGDNCWIGTNAVIGRGVLLGKECIIGANSVIMYATIGDRAIIHPGASIGQDGFGFAMGPTGHVKVPQLGSVEIGDDVEIGANTTIDRGSGPNTKIGSGTKIDNLVQIGHNVELGQHCVIVSQTGIAGSTKLGDFVVVGGQTGFAGHLQIGSGVRVAAKSGVTKNINPGETVGGFPSKPIRSWLKEVAYIERLAKRKGV